MFLNAPIPHFYCHARAEFFYNLESHHGEFFDVMVFGVASSPGRALGWHVMTDTGAVFWRLPIHALCHKKTAPARKLNELQLWDSFGEKVTATQFPALLGVKTRALLANKSTADGEYMFTVDWWGNGYSDNPGQNKCAHILQLNEGNYAALPNNRILWAESSWVSKPFETVPDFQRNTHVWKSE